MPSSLPTELLRQIIESTAPSRYHTLTYAERQQTLLRLCLVSHRFRQIAQPVLRQVICLKKSNDTREGAAAGVATVATRLHSWSKDVRELVINSEGRLEQPIITMDQVVLAFPLLDKLVVNQGPILEQSNMLALSRLSQLRNLHFDYNNLDPVRLPFLQSLTLTVFQSSRSLNLASFLNPVMLPSLQALAFVSIPYDTLVGLLRDGDTVQLLQQLDALFLPFEIFSDEAILEMKPLLSKTVVCIQHLNATVAASSQPAACRRLCSLLPHLRHAYDTADLVLAQTIESVDTLCLRTLYLDISLRMPAECPADEEARVKLLNLCSVRRIQVVFEQQARRWAVDPYISSEFWRRQRELKRLEGGQ